MAIKPAEGAEPIGGDYQKNPPPSQRRVTTQNRREEAEGGGHGMGRGHDFMQGGAGQPTFRQARIKRGKAKGQRFLAMGYPRQQPAQFLHHGGAIARHD